MSQGSVLDYLRKHQGWHNVREIAEALRITRGGVSLALKKMLGTDVIRKVVFINGTRRRIPEWRIK